jgi:hypothetical protein
MFDELTRDVAEARASAAAAAERLDATVTRARAGGACSTS